MPGRNLEYFLRLDKEVVYFVSCEGLSGSTFASKEEKIKAIIHLGMMFPGSRVIITLRPHGEYLKSLYSQYLRYGGAKSFDHFVALPWQKKLQNASHNKHLIDAGAISYCDLISAVEDAFPNPPFVCIMGDIFRDPKVFVEDLCSYVQCDPGSALTAFNNQPSNAGIKRWQAGLLRSMNKWFKVKPSLDGRYQPYSRLSKFRIDPVTICFRWLGWLPSASVVPREVVSRLNDYCADDWRFVESYVKAKPWVREKDQHCTLNSKGR